MLRKLQAVWRKHDILNESQHGYSAQRGTYTAMLQHLNLLEDAIEYGLPLHSKTWDMHKAFDSVSKNLMRMAWHRAGVPLDIAQWLAEIDINGVTVIKSNHALNTWVKRGYAGVCQPGAQASFTGAVESFSAKRGTGQGNVPSPACWNLVFDILLTMLNRDDTPPRYVRGRDNISYAARETAFADDLHSMASSHTVLQRKADIVSAFCCVMGLQLSVKKLRRFIFAYTRWEEEVPAPIIVHLDDWTPHHVEVRLRGHQEYLGVQMDPKISMR